MAGAVLLAVVASTGIVRAQTGASSEIVEYEGTVVPAREAELAPRSDGLLEKIHFRPGQLVQKNDLLFEFMSTEKELQLEMERARLARAEAKLKFAEADLANKERLRKTDDVSVSAASDAVEQGHDGCRRCRSARICQTGRVPAQGDEALCAIRRHHERASVFRGNLPEARAEKQNGAHHRSSIQFVSQPRRPSRSIMRAALLPQAMRRRDRP